MDVYENERDLFFEDKSNDVSRMTYSVACLPATTCCLPGTGIPDSRSSDQYFSDYAAKLSNLEKGETCPNELV